MANVQRDEEREARRRKVLAGHAASGLIVRAFGQQEKLNESSFYAWRRTIAQRDGEAVAPKEQAFVSAVVTDPVAAETSIAIELPYNCVLQLSGSTLS